MRRDLWCTADSASKLLLTATLWSAPPLLGQEMTGCGSRPTSAWAPGSGRAYASTAEFGHGGEDEWLATVNGAAFAADRLYVFDQGRPQVLILSADLTPVDAFGREGGGPGEFSEPFVRPWMPGYWDFGWIAAVDTAVVVYDHERLSAFDSGGEFHHSFRHFGSPIPGLGTNYVGLDARGRVLVIVDAFDARRPDEGRRLEAWRVGDDGEERVWSVELSPVRRTGGKGWINLPRDPRPFWARSGHCQVATDGTRRQLFVFDELEERLDSIGLPDWQVPPMGSLASDKGMVMVAPGQMRRGRSGGSGGDPVPRWSGLAMDPDDHAWIRLWQDPEGGGDETVYLVDVSTGAVERITVPAFPLAFGPPGVFYAMREDPDTDERYLARFTLQGTPRPGR